MAKPLTKHGGGDPSGGGDAQLSCIARWQMVICVYDYTVLCNNKIMK